MTAILCFNSLEGVLTMADIADSPHKRKLPPKAVLHLSVKGRNGEEFSMDNPADAVMKLIVRPNRVPCGKLPIISSK
jgi:hypothetical protein